MINQTEDSSDSINQNYSTSNTHSFEWGLSESVSVGHEHGLPSVSVNLSSH